MNTHPADLRVCALAVRFRQIGDDEMRGLPFYNANLEVEAVEFSLLTDDSLLGALITPWFMNLVVLPLVFEPIAAHRFRDTLKLELPGGLTKFRYGGDDVIGACWAHSLHSPMQKFATQAQARSEARLRLHQVLTPPQAVAKAANAGRRAFLTGTSASLR